MFFAVLDRQDVDIMDALCAQTRTELAEDPNAMEFFNTFSSKENVAKCDDMKRQIQEGYEPGGHRISALRGSLGTAGELLAIAFSNSFFTHTSRKKIGNFAALSCLIPVSAPHTLVLVFVCCRSFAAWGLKDDQVSILAEYAAA